MTQAPNNIDKQRITKNTLMLYLRQLLCMGLSFYTVRVVLNVLGVENYGIYNVVAGTVMLLNFLTNTMSSATQRFFSFALGRNDQEMLKCVFGTNVVLYLAITLIAVSLFETVGLWFVHTKMCIPLEKVEEARWLYQFAVAGFLASLVSSPYIAIIIAHEDMNFYAYISILDAALKLGAVVLIPFFPFPKLPLYGALLCAEAFIIASVYCLFCSFKYKECSFSELRFKRSMLKEIMGFTGWTLFGCITTVSRYQAITLLVNQFFNPAVVSARAIALNISSATSLFTNNFATGLYPPIVKAWAKNEKEEMVKLLFTGSKICFCLMIIIVFPLSMNMDFILGLWLKRVPENTSLFSILALIETSLFLICQPLVTAARAVGKMMIYELPLGVIQLFIFPISYLVLYCGGEAYMTFVVAIVTVFIMVFVRLYIMKLLIDFPVKSFIVSILAKETYCTAFAYTIALVLHTYIQKTWYMRFLLILLDVLIISVAIFLFCLTREERSFLVKKLRCNMIVAKLTGKS